MDTNYKTDYTFFYSNQLGHDQEIDWAPGPLFKVLPAMRGAESELVWQHRKWGYIRMPDSALLSCRVTAENNE